MLLHVAENVLVGVCDDELELVKDDPGPDKKVRGREVFGQLAFEHLLSRLPNPTALQKLSANDSWKKDPIEIKKAVGNIAHFQPHSYGRKSA